MASRHRNASPATEPSGKYSPHPDSPTMTSSSPRRAGESPLGAPAAPLLDAAEAKESITVTVRFRPLSPREVRLGEEIAWYADGDTIVRSEQNQSIAYAYDRVFGPTTTTRHVYDAAALHVVSGAMDGINGTIFAYGVTSSGKTHTMHGDQRSPGIIPLAVKDAFSIIQETPNREFLLRVSYLEIYNEVVNDLLNPSGQNLRIREDLQGTFVEGIKEEVVLSPAHALSLIAAGEEHRHVGSTNFNLLSSRSHTIFTLTIESSPCGESSEGEAVTFSQLNLIDLAGSESSRAETTGVRRKEGSYINKSLLTLGTVISKLTDGKATHVPFRDSKLTRLLQSSLSGKGRVSLICTVTPASSNSEETYNTLKFAQRAKHIEIQASQNKIIDEKSLIKKYQNEIRQLKEELDQLKRGILSGTPLKDPTEDSAILWKQKLEDGNVKLQSRLEQEEEAKAALLARIQRLTKLILVSTKATQTPRLSQLPGPRRRHSFGEEELTCLPHRRRDMVLNGESNDLFVLTEGFDETLEVSSKGEKKNRKGLLNWFKLRKHDGGSAALTTSDGDQSSLRKAFTAPSTPLGNGLNFQTEQGMSDALVPEDVSSDLLSVDHEEFHSDGLRGEKAPLSEIDDLKQRLCELTEAKAQLETRNQKLLEESMYAKGLASAAGIELKALSGEVTKLMNHNERLASELASARNSTQRRVNNGQRVGRRDSFTKRHEAASRRDVHASYERDQALEVMLMEKDQREAELQKKIEESKQKEAFLEGELANMWVLVAKLKKGQGVGQDDMDAKLNGS